jgi:high affinity sulfate transporter 1
MDTHGGSPPSLSSPPMSAAGVGIPAAPETGLMAWFPGLWMLRRYQRAWLARDLVAGLVLTALLVPAGMGYAEASGLPAITGLYATIAPLLAYALFGPSRIMVLGPDSALAPLIAVAVVGRAGGDPTRALALGSVLALLTGAMCLLAGVLRAGAVTDLLSRPVRVGYMNGIGLTVLLTQLPKLCGFSAAGPDLLAGALAFARGVAEGRVVAEALLIGLACLGTILLGRRLAPRFPSVLLAVVGATIAVSLLGLSDRLRVVGEVPRGVPWPSLPWVSFAELGELVLAAAGIALVSFADTSVLSRTVAGRNRYRVDANRELIGLGFANLAAGLFSGFPVSSSSSRTPVAEAAGSRTQLTGVVGALSILLLLLVAPGLLRNLPTAALAAVVIGAALRIFDWKSLGVFARVRRADFALSIITFLAVAGLGVLAGIGVAVVLSLLDFVRRAWHPHYAVLGRARGVKGYHDIRRYKEAKQVPGLLLLRWDAPLFFANADGFRERIIHAVDETRVPVRWVVIAAEPITDVDTTAAEMLEELDRELSLRGAELAFAELKDPVRDRLARYGLHDRVGRDFFFPTIGVAVKAYLERNEVTWTDWEEGGEGAPSPARES